MMVFSLVAIPLGCALVLAFSGERGSVLSPIVRGVIWYVPLFVAVMFVRIHLVLRYDPPGIFWFFAIRDGYVPYAAAIFGFVVFYRRIIVEDDRAMVFLFTVFSASLLTVVSWGEIVLGDTSYNAYRQLVLPAQRMAVVMLLPVLGGAIIRESRIVLRLLYAIGIIVYPALLAVSPLLFTLQFRAGGVTAGALIAVVGAAGGILLRKIYFPERGFVAMPEDSGSLESVSPSPNATAARPRPF
ncbi:MAG: hypothetical protein EA403_16790 [Spirochaetaceae bacterium]|nr:MAG: hypothetical protein EA403_16790 [Spirochaetaceae bacterium]